MVGVHVCQFGVDEETDLVLALLLLLSDVRCDDPLRLFTKTGITVHLVQGLLKRSKHFVGDQIDQLRGGVFKFLYLQFRYLLERPVWREEA